MTVRCTEGDKRGSPKQKELDLVAIRALTNEFFLVVIREGLFSGQSIPEAVDTLLITACGEKAETVKEPPDLADF